MKLFELKGYEREKDSFFFSLSKRIFRAIVVEGLGG